MSRTSMILMGVALTLLSFIVFFERGSLSTTEREGRKGHVLESFVKDRVTRIELQRRGVTTVLVHVEPKPDDPLDIGGWQVEAPYHARADKALVDELLGALEWAEARRSLGDASSEELAQFGLSAPRYRVTYVAGRDRAGFSVGLPAANGGGSYLKLNDKPAVYVVGGDLLEYLARPAEDFHEKTLHEGVTIYTLEKLQLTDASGVERKVVNRDELFWLERPFVGLANKPVLTELMNALDMLKAERYIAPSAHPEYALDKPRLTIVVESLVYDRKLKDKRKDEKLELRVGGVCAEHSADVYVQVNGKAVYCIASAELAKIDIGAEALRDARPLPLEDHAITGVELHDGVRELTLQTNEQATRFRVSEQGRELASGLADSQALNDWYAALRSSAAETIAPLEPAEHERLAQSPLVATFKRGKNQAPYVVHWLNAADGGLSFWRMEEPTVLQLPAAARPVWTAMGARFRKKRVLEENEAQFSALTVTDALGVREHVIKDGGGYALDAPQKLPADRAVVDELLRMLSKLDVLRFVADQPLPEHGFATPYSTLVVDYAGGGKTRQHTLVIGSKAGNDGRFAKLDDLPAVFVVPDALSNKLSSSLAKRP